MKKMLMFVLLCAGFAVYAKPMPPIAMQIEPLDPLPVNAYTTLKVTVTALSSVDSVHLYMVFPNGVKLTDGESQWTGSLSPGDEARLNLQVYIPESASGEIEAVAKTGGESAAYTVKRKFSIGTRQQKSQIPPPGREVERQGEKVREFAL